MVCWAQHSSLVLQVTANLLLIPVVFALRKGLLHRRISQAQGTVASLCFFVSLYAIAPSLTGMHLGFCFFFRRPAGILWIG